MGTRHLIAVQLGGEYKIAQYGQWDGYPDGQGVRILHFLRSEMKEQFLTSLAACKFASEEEIRATWDEFGGVSSDGFVRYDIAKRHDAKWASIYRDTGADILSLVQNAKEPLLLIDSISFAGDSLFCEYAYVIDFDKGTFEVFEGFNKKPLDVSERFANAPRDKNADGSESKYYPVKLRATFRLDNLPDKKSFLEIFDPPEEGAEQEEPQS